MTLNLPKTEGEAFDRCVTLSEELGMGLDFNFIKRTYIVEYDRKTKHTFSHVLDALTYLEGVKKFRARASLLT